jgi:hypothetical protein
MMIMMITPTVTVEALPKFISEVLLIVNTATEWGDFWQLVEALPGYSRTFSDELLDRENGDFALVYEKDVYLFRFITNTHYEVENVGRPEVIIPSDQHKDWRSLRKKLESDFPEITWVFSTTGGDTTTFYEEFCDSGLDSIIQATEDQLKD